MLDGFISYTRTSLHNEQIEGESIMQNAVSILHNGQTLRGMAHIPAGENLPTLILLHGFTGTKLEPHRLFLKISRVLEEKEIACFRFDFLGSGESDGNFEDMTVLKELEEARTIFQYVESHPAIDKDRVMVLGFSMGGLVASLLGGDIQDRIHKLVLMAPAGTMGHIASYIKENLIYIESHDAYDNAGNLSGKAFVEELAGLEVWEKAARYQNEVLLIHGTEDQAVPFEVSSLYINHCYQQKATLHPIEGAGHTFDSFIWEKEVIQTICKFVG